MSENYEELESRCQMLESALKWALPWAYQGIDKLVSSGPASKMHLDIYRNAVKLLEEKEICEKCHKKPVTMTTSDMNYCDDCYPGFE